MMDERLDDDIARRHRDELDHDDLADKRFYHEPLSHASDFKCSGEHDPISGACLKGEEE